MQCPSCTIAKGAPMYTNHHKQVAGDRVFWVCWCGGVTEEIPQSDEWGTCSKCGDDVQFGQGHECPKETE